MFFSEYFENEMCLSELCLGDKALIGKSVLDDGEGAKVVLKVLFEDSLIAV